MKYVLFCHSLVSDWNHGNAHFLRGVAAELIGRGHEVVAYEPADGWSRQHLLADGGDAAIAAFHRAFPALQSHAYTLDDLDLDRVLDGASVVLVHEWNPAALIERIGRHKRRGGRYALFFHDTHHRSLSESGTIASFDLQDYDGVLAFGDVIRERYLSAGWGRRAWTWHEAADVRVFQPCDEAPASDLIWIGNWGDDERSAEIGTYLIEPVAALGLTATVHGVRYPDAAVRALAAAGIRYGGWLPNHEAPRAYARHRMTVHIPRRPYLESLPGIPTIRVFEALACGIPLVSVAWRDVEGLFTEGRDYLVAADPAAMHAHLRALRADADLRQSLAAHGLATIRARHTCAHRVDQLLDIVSAVRQGEPTEVLSA
jgi:spore maturation protein CgeB